VGPGASLDDRTAPGAIGSYRRNYTLHRGEVGDSRRAVVEATVVIALVCAVALYIGLLDPIR
jgi:hypothetical protein